MKASGTKVLALFLLFFLCALSFSARVSFADIPKTIQYEGKLVSKGNLAADGMYSMTFSIYDSSTGGTALWTETQQVQVTTGVFSALLGNTTPVALSFDKQYYMGLSVNGEAEMTPRQTLSSAGYSFNADTVDTFHASSTAAANTLLPLDANAKLPASVIDTTSAANMVTQIVAGSNVTISPAAGTGAVTISATGGSGGAGTVTSVATGTGLTGGPVTGSGTISIASGGVSSTEILDGTIANADISDSAAIAKSKLAALGIVNADVDAAAALATSKISGAVTSITGHGLGALAALNAVGSSEITDSAISFSDIGANGCAANQIMKYDGAAWVCAADASSGGIEVGSVSTTEILDGTIANADISATAALATSKISGAVTSITGHGLGALATLNAVGSAEITDGVVVNADISATAAIATSKISGAVTSITGHGLGGLATLSAVGSAEITDGVIANADISATAAIASSKISGGPFIAATPSSAQTIQPSADVVPLIIKDDTVGITANLLDVQDNAGTSLVKVSGSGNLLVGSPTWTTAKLSAYEIGANNNAGYFEINNAGNPFTAVYATTNGSANAVNGVTTGTGTAGKFEINNAANGNPALSATTNGTSNAVYGFNSGTGRAGYFEINNAANTANAFYATTNGTGDAGRFQISNAANANSALYGTTSGTGIAGYFQISNAANANPAVYGLTAGTGKGVWGYTTGTGQAGYFQISNAANGSESVYSLTNGTGSAGNFVISNFANGSASLIGATVGTGHAIWGYTNGTGRAGNFQIANVASAASALYVITSGTGKYIEASNGAFLSNAGVWTNASSRELKQDIAPLTSEQYEQALEKLLKTDVVYFKYKKDTSEIHIGLIAEDAPEEMVDKEKKGVYTADSIGMLLAALKAQQKQIEAQSAEMEILKQKIKTLEGAIK